MTFDSNRAWQDAVAAVKANREVLLALGGVFFLLPTLLSTVFLTDLQTQIMENVGKEAEVNRLVLDNLGTLLGFGLGGTVVQMIGYVAVMALLSDRGRPTVGEAIGGGLRGLPTLIAVGLLFFVATVFASFLATLALAGLFSLAGQPVLGAVIAVIAVIVLLAWASVRLSLVMPAVVMEGIAGPVAAMVRSWRLTKGNSLRLFGFFTMLSIAYVALALVATFMVMGPLLIAFGQGTATLIATGLVTGAIGALASVVLIAVLAQIHRQLAGDAPERQANLFE